MPNEMNYIMDYRLIHCLRNGLPLDQDVYDALNDLKIAQFTMKEGKIIVETPQNNKKDTYLH